MQILTDLLETIQPSEVLRVCIGLNWTAVEINHDGIGQCGIASTLIESHKHSEEPRIEPAGRFEDFSSMELAQFVLSENPTLRSVGIAALNASITTAVKKFKESNAAEVLAERGKDKKIVLIGKFPFADRLRSQVGELAVIDQDPGPGDYPPEEADKIIPKADVVAITGMALINNTFENLLDLCPAGAFVMVLGPSAPLSPVLFDYGVDVISGAVVEKIDNVIKVINQGGNFRQVHHAGVRLVNLFK